MLKPDSLRRALTDAVTVLKTSPEMLRIFVDNGSIASTLATSLSFEKRYTLNVIVTDFTGDFDLLIVPVLAWLRENQPDIMTTDEGQKKGFTFYPRQPGTGINGILRREVAENRQCASVRSVGRNPERR
ncbi:tail protein [Escherichia coli]|nr:tail protein [Escherichia coli]SQQ75369.1 tail protein [Escherichia coli]SQS55743.1 tail protein [Escherichia coli]